MKKINISVILGCCIISIGIILAGFIIANKLPETPFIPNNLSVTTTDGTTVSNEYLSEYEASAFARVNVDDFQRIIGTGDLDWTFTIIQGNRVFSKEKLSLWLEIRIQDSIKD